jgi:type III secretory pathway component EscU
MITLLCLNIAYTYGIRTVTALFWFKIITLGLIIYFINSYKTEEFYYYKNLGFTKKFLWKTTLIFELIMFVVLLAFTIKIR